MKPLNLDTLTIKDAQKIFLDGCWEGAPNYQIQDIVEAFILGWNKGKEAGLAERNAYRLQAERMYHRGVAFGKTIANGAGYVYPKSSELLAIIDKEAMRHE